MTWVDPRLQRSRNAAGDVVVRLRVPQLDAYPEFLAARSRPNTVLAVGHDLMVFFAVVGNPPAQGTAADVLGFVTTQHTGATEYRMCEGIPGQGARHPEGPLWCSNDATVEDAVRPLRRSA